MYSTDTQQHFVALSKKFISSPATANDLKELRDLLVFHERKYYIEDSPLISDFEYDILYKQLVSLEEQYPDQITPDSPTQRVSTDLSGDFPPVQHTVPMLSLDNSYDEFQVYKFDKTIKKLCFIREIENVEYTVEPKFDGGSIALVYENDFLVRAATRGDGAMGEDITPNAKTLPSIPIKVAFSTKGIVKAELRGEALIRKDNFNRINKERESKGEKLFANPRNAATGGLRTKDPNETRNRKLEVFVYHLAYAIDKEGNSVLSDLNFHYNIIELLEELGFKTPKKEMLLCNNINEVYFCIEKWMDRREKYEYEIDGMVIKVNSISLQEKCGFTSHHPKWATAFKFLAKQATSKLLSVEYQVGKIGSITPVAKIQPIDLAGVTVSSISLHNEDFITSKDLRLGDMVLVERAGDVIPYIVKSFPEQRKGDEKVISFPEFCPINPTEGDVALIKEEGESAWRCPNCVCGAQDIQKMIFHVSKDAMDIRVLGEKTLILFYNKKIIKDISDIYNLNLNKIIHLQGFQDKKINNITESIENAKKNPIQRLLYSLSIHHLGKRASKLIAEQISHVLDLQNWEKERYLEIKDIGPVVAENVSSWFANEKNITMLQKMESYGVNLTQTDEDKPLQVAEDAVFSGKTILFTGTLLKMGRKEAEEKAAKAGARNISAVSANLNILVVGEKAGSKLKKAQELGTVQILTEDEFLNLIG